MPVPVVTEVIMPQPGVVSADAVRSGIRSFDIAVDVNVVVVAVDVYARRLFFGVGGGGGVVLIRGRGVLL